MTNKDVIELWNKLNELANNSFPGFTKFRYFVARNISILTGPIQVMQASNTPSKEFQQFNDERVKLARGYAIKAEDGQLILDAQGNFRIPFDKLSMLEMDIEALKKDKYPGVVEEEEARIEDWNKFLADEYSVIDYMLLHKIKMGDTPEMVNAAQLSVFLTCNLILEDEA